MNIFDIGWMDYMGYCDMCPPYTTQLQRDEWWKGWSAAKEWYGECNVSPNLTSYTPINQSTTLPK